jgi:hypothetical protein
LNVHKIDYGGRIINRAKEEIDVEVDFDFLLKKDAIRTQKNTGK